MKSPIQIISLPVSRWKEYRNLRFESLKREPQAFGTPFAEAVKRPNDEWIQILRAAETENKDILIFAQDGKKLIGIIGAYFNKDPKNQHIGNIYGVYVNSSYRGCGIGKQLLKKVLERLRSIKGLKKARLMVNQEQKAAVNLYQRSDFAIVGTEKMVLGDGKQHDEYVMEKVF